MKDYREAYAEGDYEKAEKLLEKSVLKKDGKAQLLWNLEKGTVALAQGNENSAIAHFQTSLDLIDKLFTTKLSAKAASLLINDASDMFYGANYERSYAHYFLSRAYYQRFQKTQNKQDLQGARATILAWDTYFTELQRGSTTKTMYHTDFMMKMFGGEVHEVSEIKNDKQIALQLYKDALRMMDVEGGIFSLFNQKNTEYIKAYEKAVKEGKAPKDSVFVKTPAYQDLKDFIIYKILSLTKEVRGFDYAAQVKSLSPSEAVLKKIASGKANVVFVFEEGLIPAKIGKQFSFGIKGAAMAVENPTVRNFILNTGAEIVASFAMNTLGMVPSAQDGAGSMIFGAAATKLAVTEAAIEFELPMIDTVPLVPRYEVFVLNDKGVVVQHSPLPVVSENGDIARVVLEEEAVSRYVKTGTRVAIKHLVAIVAAMQVYQRLKDKSGDFLAKGAAMAAYVGASKGISALEKADTRHWTTLPQALRMAEFKLSPGEYQLAIGTYSGTKAPEAPSKIIGNVQVKSSGKEIHTLHITQ